jgi:hypothetical protein
MRAKSYKKNKINVITLGCSKNVYDSEVLMGQLSANKIAVDNCPIKTSESYTFFEHPNVMTFILFFL